MRRFSYSPDMPKHTQRHDDRDDLYVDANGDLTEEVSFGDTTVVIRYADIPESDITIVDGFRCTTPVRTVIDIATTTEPAELKRIVGDLLERKLFTLADAEARLAAPDMAEHPGAALLRGALPPT